MPQLFGMRGSSLHVEDAGHGDGFARRPPHEGYSLLATQMPLHLLRSVHEGETGVQVVLSGQGAIFRPQGRSVGPAATKLARPTVARAKMLLVSILSKLSWMECLSGRNWQRMLTQKDTLAGQLSLYLGLKPPSGALDARHASPPSRVLLMGSRGDRSCGDVSRSDSIRRHAPRDDGANRRL